LLLPSLILSRKKPTSLVYCGEVLLTDLKNDTFINRKSPENVGGFNGA
jgi:hypothetical protein